MEANGNENDMLQSVLTENKILKGKLRGFKTLDKMFKDVKEKNIALEDEITQLKEKHPEKPIPLESQMEFVEADFPCLDANPHPFTNKNNEIDETFEYVPKASELGDKLPQATKKHEPEQYKLPTPKNSMLENMSIATELRSILDHRYVTFPDDKKLGEELKKLADSISEIEEKRQRDQEVLKVLTKELKKCKSENEIFRRENDHFQKRFLPFQAGTAEKEKYVYVENDPLANNSDQWKDMYFVTKNKSDQDITDLRKHLEIKNRENNQLETRLANKTKQHDMEIAELIKEMSLKYETNKPENEDDMISQQMQIFQDDFKVEHDERMKAQAAKLEMEKKFDALQKEFQDRNNLIFYNERKLKFYMEKCEMLTKEKLLIKNELDLAQQNLKRASEFITNLPTPQPKLTEAEKHVKRLERISALTTNNGTEDNYSEIANWKCPTCTLENKPWAYNCAICKGRKPDSIQFSSNINFDDIEVDGPPSFSILDSSVDSK